MAEGRGGAVRRAGWRLVLAWLPGLLGALALAPPVPAQPAPAGPEAPLIREIEIRSDVPLAVAEAVEPYLALEVGGRLTEDGARRSLNNLYASGRVARVAITSRPVPEGVVAVVSLWSNLLVEEIGFEGELAGLRRSELQAAVPQQPGQPLIESRVVQGDFQLEELYESRGYLGVRVSLEISPPDRRNRVRITYRIDPGKRAIVSAVDIDGSLGPFSEEELVQQLRSRPGEPFRERTAEDDAERLRSWLLSQGYRTATVDLVSQDREPEEGRVALRFRVEVGPRVELEVVGVEADRLRQHNLLPFLGPDGYDEALLLQAEQRIKTHYQRQGHYRVEVSTREGRTESGALRIRVEVEPGPVFTLERVAFTGNETFPDQRLAELVETSAERLLGFGDGRLVDEVLSADLRNLRTFYALQGFPAAEVGPPEVEGLAGSARRLALTIPIEEGERRTVGRLSFEGLESLEEGEARRLFRLEEGGGYNESLLEESLDNLRARYDEMGYTRAQVSSTVSWGEAHTVADVAVRVLEGPQQRLGSILVTGNQKTDTPVVLRALEVSPGDPISGTRLLDMERNLYRLGIFSWVEVEFTPADLGATRRDVVVRVREGKTRSVILQAGYDSDDRARGLVGLSLRNVFGRTHAFNADLRLSQEDSRARVAFEQRHLRWLPFGMLYEVFRIEQERESYQANRRIARVQTLPPQDRRRFSLGLDLRRIEPEDFEAPLVARRDEDGRPVLEPGVLSPLEIGEGGNPRSVRVFSLLPSFQWENRDDPLEPTRGWFNTTELQVAVPAFSADASYAKLFVHQAHYLPVGEAGVLALGLRLGAIEPLRTVEGAEGDPLLSVPLDERFFAGGRTTHRAFSRFALGIDGETRLFDGDDRASFGGNGLVLANVEYRFPVFGAIGGTVFFDSGNVWRDWRDVDSRFRNGVGVGVRYSSPIGPLRVDLGYKLDAEPEESDWEVHFTFGHPF